MTYTPEEQKLIDKIHKELNDSLLESLVGIPNTESGRQIIKNTVRKQVDNILLKNRIGREIPKIEVTTNESNKSQVDVDFYDPATGKRLTVQELLEYLGIDK